MKIPVKSAGLLLGPLLFIIISRLTFIGSLEPGSWKGRNLVPWEATRRMPWGILLLFGGGLALATIFLPLAIGIAGGLGLDPLLLSALLAMASSCAFMFTCLNTPERDSIFKRSCQCKPDGQNRLYPERGFSSSPPGCVTFCD